jgi:RHS repeat-associated protein
MQARSLIRLIILSTSCLLSRPAFAGEYVLYYHNDALGSPQAMTDINGNVVWRADYEPFGNLATITETLANTREFIGKQRDPETGLHYFGARFYDGGIGRFLSVDPALLRGRPDSALTIPQRLNLYAYSTNNPYRYLDSRGTYLETAFDLVSLGLSIHAYHSDPSFINTLAVAYDTFAAVTPLLPAGAGIIVKGGSKIRGREAANSAGKQALRTADSLGESQNT